jgi:1-acyl-sn-glycerol-3-phosphate acyltransferase
MKTIQRSRASSRSALLMRFYRWIWLGRIESRPPEIPRGSLILAAHYNGLVDAFVYGSQLSSFIGVISAQWHLSFVGRWLLPGIAVKRAKDRGANAINLTAFRLMVGQMQAGERLLFFPEGTSRLGPARLPIQPGTLLLLRLLRREPAPPAVFFAAACYHQPTLWRSSVSVAWVGPLDLPTSPDGDIDWISAGLLKAQAAAYARPIPSSSRVTWLAPVVALPFLPAWFLAASLARRTADDENVIALWKFIFGVPVTLLALGGLTAIFVLIGWPWCMPLASLIGGWLLWKK